MRDFTAKKKELEKAKKSFIVGMPTNLDSIDKKQRTATATLLKKVKDIGVWLSEQSNVKLAEPVTIHFLTGKDKDRFFEKNSNYKDLSKIKFNYQEAAQQLKGQIPDLKYKRFSVPTEQLSQVQKAFKKMDAEQINSLKEKLTKNKLNEALQFVTYWEALQTTEKDAETNNQFMFDVFKYCQSKSSEQAASSASAS